MNQASDFMTRLKKSAISLILLLLLLQGNLYSQNIYDESHSREFALYLMQSHQFQLASSEWERVLFLSPADTLARLNLLKSLRLSEKSADGWLKFNQWFPSGLLSRPFSQEAIQITLSQGDFTSFRSILDRSPGLSASERSHYLLGSWLMEGNWISQPAKLRSPAFTINTNDPRLLDLYSRTLNINRKSPAASVALSAIVPGLGKIYSHDWKDGLLSLLFVATNAWQSYRGFSKNGVRSVTGWVFGTLGAGFYTANLFGSWKSANTYNSKQVDIIRHETEDIIYTR